MILFTVALCCVLGAALYPTDVTLIGVGAALTFQVLVAVLCSPGDLGTDRPRDRGEAAAVVRGVPSPRPPLLPGVQSLAAHWLAAAALVVSPLVGGPGPGGPQPLVLASVVDDGPSAVADATAPPRHDQERTMGASALCRVMVSASQTPGQ